MEEEFATISNLKYLYLENLKQIKYSSFKNNKVIEGVFIKSKNGNMAEYIQNYAFQNCVNLCMFATTNNSSEFVIDYENSSDFEFFLGSTLGGESFANTQISDLYIINIPVKITTGNYNDLLSWVMSKSAFIDSNTTLHLVDVEIEQTAINAIKNNYYFVDVVDCTIV